MVTTGVPARSRSSSEQINGMDAAPASSATVDTTAWSIAASEEPAATAETSSDVPPAVTMTPSRPSATLTQSRPSPARRGDSGTSGSGERGASLDPRGSSVSGRLDDAAADPVESGTTSVSCWRPCSARILRISSPIAPGSAPGERRTRTPAGVAEPSSISACSTPGRLSRSSRNVPTPTPASPHLPLSRPVPPLKIRHHVCRINSSFAAAVCGGDAPPDDLIVWYGKEGAFAPPALWRKRHDRRRRGPPEPRSANHRCNYTTVEHERSMAASVPARARSDPT